MAYSFGGGVNAQLGAVDYSPFLRGSLQGSKMAAQGATMQGQAIGKAGGAIGQSIIQAAQEYKAKQEKKQKEAEVVTMATGLFSRNPELMKNMGLTGDVYSPENQKAISAISKNFPPEQLMKFGMEFQQQQEERERQQSQGAAIARAMRGTSQAERMLQGGASFEQIDGASFRPEPVGAMDFMQQAIAGGADPKSVIAMAQVIQSSQGRPVNPLEQQKLAAEIRKIQAEATALGNKGKPLGFSTPQEAIQAVGLDPGDSKVEFNNAAGGYVARPLDPIEIEGLKAKQNAAIEAIKKGDQDTATAILRGVEAKAKLESTLNTVREAIVLSEMGTGGPVAGTGFARKLGAISTALPGGIGDYMKSLGADKGTRLNALYTTIQSNLALAELTNLRELSQNGASGMGVLSDKDIDLLKTAQASINIELPEDMQLEQLKKVEGVLTRWVAIKPVKTNFSAGTKKYLE